MWRRNASSWLGLNSGEPRSHAPRIASSESTTVSRRRSATACTARRASARAKRVSNSVRYRAVGMSSRTRSLKACLMTRSKKTGSNPEDTAASLSNLACARAEPRSPPSWPASHLGSSLVRLGVLGLEGGLSLSPCLIGHLCPLHQPRAPRSAQLAGPQRTGLIEAQQQPLHASGPFTPGDGRRGVEKDDLNQSFHSSLLSFHWRLLRHTASRYHSGSLPPTECGLPARGSTRES